MIFFAFLPFIFIMLFWRWLVLRGLEVREGFLAAHVASGLLIVLSTEGLTAVTQLHFISLLLFWLLALSIMAFLLARSPGALAWRGPAFSLTLIEKVLLGMAAFIVIGVGFIALYAPPNTWDSMTYHLSRVGYWRQDHGVMNYPTNSIRQLVYSPFAEYVILQLQVLSSGDRLANMVQWSAMVGSAIGVSLAASYLGVSRFGQLVAALLVLTLPMGILEGSSTQNDHVSAFQVIVAGCFLLKYRACPARRWAFLSAAALGLAVLTKGLGALYAGAFLVVWLIMPGIDIRRRLGWPLLAVVMIVVVGAPFFLRLTQIDRDPFAAINSGGTVTMGRVGPLETASNALRGLSTQLATPWQSWNQAIEGAVIRWHQGTGIDIVDPQTTSGTPYRLMYYLDEDYMPNPLHALLLIIASVAFWFIRGKSLSVWFYGTALVFQALAFCVLVRWQPWISRFHLPVFIMAIPLAAFAAERFVPRKFLAGIVVILFMAALHPLLLNNTRRIFSEKSMFRFSREQNYFSKHAWEYPVADRVVALLKKSDCREVGLKLGGDDWDYIWRALLGDGFRVEHVGVTGPTAAFPYPAGDFHPCVVLDSQAKNKPHDAIYNGRPFVKAAESQDLTVYADPNYRKPGS
ncbi:MAG: hypothetical protein WCO69_04640 [Candidatus Omnitrophota bacterium]